jgi:hypothetical protein
MAVAMRPARTFVLVAAPGLGRYRRNTYRMSSFRVMS